MPLKNSMERNPMRNQVVARLRKDLRELFEDKSGTEILVINLEKLDQSKKPPEERADVLVDAIVNHDDIRAFLASEPDTRIIQDEQKQGSDSVRQFYLKLKQGA